MLYLVHMRVAERSCLPGLAVSGLLFSLWIEKDWCLDVGGFVPSPLGDCRALSAHPAGMVEIAIGIWAIGALMITVLYKIHE